MTRLIFKIGLLILLLFFLANVCSAVILEYRPLIKLFGVDKKAFRIYNVIDKSKSKITSDTVLLGDSVGNQLFQRDKEYNLITNMGATIVGNYIILNNALKNNKNIRRVFMVCNPNSLTAKFYHDGTYNYFVKPFYIQEYAPLLSERVEEYLMRHKFYRLYKLPIAKVLPVFSLIDSGSAINPSADEYDIFIEYMKNIQELCDKNNVKLIVLPTPISASINQEFVSQHKFDRMKKIISENQLDDLFMNYFDILTVLDDKYFSDRFHYNAGNKTQISSLFRDVTKKFVQVPD